MLATAGMYAEDVSSNEVAILGKMSRGNSDIGDSGLAEIVALRHRDGCDGISLSLGSVGWLTAGTPHEGDGWLLRSPRQ
jgi:hypothetical protein